MRVITTCLLCLPITLSAAEPALPAGPPVDLRPRWLGDSVVEQAVLATLAELPPEAAGGRPDLLRSTAEANFARDFDYARIPGCLRTDGLKFQPTRLGPFTVKGIRAGFPFMIIAKLRGKCD